MTDGQQAPRRLEYMPLDQVRFAEDNPKAHDVDGVAGSIGQFGLAAVPTKDERTGRLVAGHGRIRSLRKMRDEGQAPPDGVMVDTATGDWLVPVLAGWRSRSDVDAKAYLVGDNQWTISPGWDNRQLAGLLGEIRDVDPALLKHTAWSVEGLDDLIASFDAPPDLDRLADDYGEPTDEAGWPTIRHHVPHNLQLRWQALLDAANRDGDRAEWQQVERVIEWAEAGASHA